MMYEMQKRLSVTVYMCAREHVKMWFVILITDINLFSQWSPL